MNMKKTVQLILFLFLFINAFAQKKLLPGEHFAHINGFKMHYYVSGSGPVCLVPSPGWGPSINYLKKSLQPFEKVFTMVYYDTRISGLSTGPKDPSQYTSNNFMDDMDSLRSYLGQPKVWLIGHTAGGFQALYYGIHHNDELNGMIVIDAIAGKDSLYEKEVTRMIKKREGQPYYQKGADILFDKDTVHYTNSQARKYVLPFYFHDTTKIKDFENLHPQISDKASVYTDVSKFASEYLFPDLHKITVPTLVIVGDDDFISNKVSEADRIAAMIPSSTEIVIKDAGHFCWIEQPGQFFTQCLQWLKTQAVQ